MRSFESREARERHAASAFASVAGSGDAPFKTGASRAALGNADGRQWALGVGRGYDFGKSAFRFGPTGAINYVRVDVDGFTEHTTGTHGPAMQFEDQQADSLTIRIGAQMSYVLSLKWGILSPNARFDMIREYRTESRSMGWKSITSEKISFGLRCETNFH